MDSYLTIQPRPGGGSDVLMSQAILHALADSLIVVTPLDSDATDAIVAGGLDARRAVAFDGLFPGQRIRCLFANPGLAQEWRERARAAFAAEDVLVHLVRDSVGLIAQRVLASIVNVASSIAEQRIASPSGIDRAVKIGLGYPRGPLSWGDALGVARFIASSLACWPLPAIRATDPRPGSRVARRSACQHCTATNCGDVFRILAVCTISPVIGGSRGVPR